MTVLAKTQQSIAAAISHLPTHPTHPTHTPTHHSSTCNTNTTPHTHTTQQESMHYMGILGFFTTGIARICKYGVFQQWDGDTASAGGVATRFSCKDAAKMQLFSFWEHKRCYLVTFASIALCGCYFCACELLHTSSAHLGKDCFGYRHIPATFWLFAAWMVHDGYSIGALTFLGLLFWLLLLFWIFLAFLYCKRIKSAAIPISIALEAATFACLSVLIKGICYLILFQHKCCY